MPIKNKYLPNIMNVIFNQRISSFPSVIAAQQQAIPAHIRVPLNSHFLPTLDMMYIAIAIAGISTSPAKAYKLNTKASIILCSS